MNTNKYTETTVLPEGYEIVLNPNSSCESYEIVYFRWKGIGKEVKRMPFLRIEIEDEYCYGYK